MRLWARLLLAILILFGAAFGVAYWVGTARWNAVTVGMVDELNAAPSRQEAKAVSFKRLGSLPAPVLRYFRMALKDGQPLIRSARMTQRGEFLVAPKDNRWGPFEATQHFSADPPGFVWDARMRLSSLMDVRVRDAYLAGHGSMEARAAALVPVLEEEGKTELDAAALQRYLAEAIWFPTALLPRPGLTWKAVDTTRARATLTDSGVTVSLEFRFNEKGEITGVFSPGRYREEGGKFVLTPWIVTVRRYEERSGMRIPIEAEVSWRPPDGPQPYWKGKIVDARYEFVK
jgi:Family of unknown function (DUF6920)